MYHSKSAPLPLDYKWCKGTDLALSNRNSWFQWKPRLLDAERQKSVGVARICYWEDRGAAKNVNDLERD